MPWWSLYKGSSSRFLYAVTRVHPELPILLCCDQGSSRVADPSMLWPGFNQSCRSLYVVTRVHPELPIPLCCDQGSTRVADPSTLWPGFIQSCWSLYAVHPELLIPLRCDQGSSRVADPSKPMLGPGAHQGSSRVVDTPTSTPWMELNLRYAPRCVYFLVWSMMRTSVVTKLCIVQHFV